jgi:hypothetical protein
VILEISFNIPTIIAMYCAFLVITAHIYSQDQLCKTPLQAAGPALTKTGPYFVRTRPLFSMTDIGGKRIQTLLCIAKTTRKIANKCIGKLATAEKAI